DPGEAPSQPLLEALREVHAVGTRIAGLCSGAFVLAAAGLLYDRPATTHWAVAGVLARMYPKIDVRPAHLYIDDGDVLTAGGGAAGMDLGLHLLRVQYGAEVANRLARYMVVPPHRPGDQAQYVETSLPVLDQTDPVGETLAWALGQLDPAPAARGCAGGSSPAGSARSPAPHRPPGSPISACCARSSCSSRPGCRSNRWHGSAGSPAAPRCGRTSGVWSAPLPPPTEPRS